MEKLRKIFSLIVVIITVFGIFTAYTNSYEISKYPINSNYKFWTSNNFNPTLSEMIQLVNETVIKNHIQIIQEFGPHPTGSDEIEQLKEYLYDQFIDYGLIVELQHWKYKLKSGFNIEASIPGMGSGDGIVIICAHYDSVSISPGADDDGSGVASILTMAEIMSSYEYNSTIKFVLFSGEEQGLYGSHEYAKNAYENDDNIIGVICLDGVGYADSYLSGHTIKNFADDSSDWIVNISTTITEDYKEFVDLEIERYPNEKISDHHSFYELGFQTSYFLEHTLNPFYHTSEDTLDKMNISYLTKVCRLSLGTVFGMAEVNRILENDEINIIIKGSILSVPNQLIVGVKNYNLIDSANISINIEMKNFFTDKYVEGPYNSSSNWIFTKEIEDYWEFILAAHRYKKPELIKLDVTIKGFNEDVGVFKKQHTIGLVTKSLILLIPRI